MEACIEYKADRGYGGADSESVRNKYEQIQEKIIQQYSINSTDGFSNSENAEQTLTVKRIGGKLKTIRTNLKKAVDTNKRSSGGRVVITFYRLCEKLWSGSPAITSIENSIDTFSSTNRSTENNDSENMTPFSDEGSGYALESGSNFEESNYSDEATERRIKIRKSLKNHMSESLSSKSNAEPQMLQCYKDYLNLKRKMTENMEASEENFKERISKVNKTIEGIGTAITQSVQLLSELVKVRQNPATCQFPQEIFHNMNSCITN